MRETHPDRPHPGSRNPSSPEPPARGWKDVLKRVWAAIQADELTFMGAAIAFYLMLAFVPLIGAIVSLYGLVANPADVQRQSEQLRGIVPAEVLQLFQSQLTRLSQSSSAGLASVIGFLLAIWGGSAAMEALITGLNTAYKEEEKRGFLKRRLTSLLLTLASVLVVVTAVGFAVLSPAVLHFVPLPGVSKQLIRWAGWIVLLLLVAVWMSVLYRFGPCRCHPRWQWVSWGAAVASLIWIAISAGFSFYVSNFGNYEGSYGSLGAVMILLLWFYLSGIATLVGAELNGELERRASMDSAASPESPELRDAPAPEGLPEDHRKAG